MTSISGVATLLVEQNGRGRFPRRLDVERALEAVQLASDYSDYVVANGIQLPSKSRLHARMLSSTNHGNADGLD
jgi:hypothetical protein